MIVLADQLVILEVTRLPKGKDKEESPARKFQACMIPAAGLPARLLNRKLHNAGPLTENQ